MIDAALELATERGTQDAIQMRDIAERSNVALGTIYKYYSSKQQVLAAAHVAWAMRLEEMETETTLPDDIPLVEHAVAMLRRVTTTVEREPNLYRALFLPTVLASEDMENINSDLSRLLSRLFKNALGGLDDTNRRGIQRILQQVWFASLMRWVNGWGELSEVGDELEFTCRWLFTGPPATLAGRAHPKPLLHGAIRD